MSDYDNRVLSLRDYARTLLCDSVRRTLGYALVLNSSLHNPPNLSLRFLSFFQEQLQKSHDSMKRNQQLTNVDDPKMNQLFIDLYNEYSSIQNLIAETYDTGKVKNLINPVKHLSDTLVKIFVPIFRNSSSNPCNY